ncbi:Histone deacetylase 14 [Dichanthelium oligosanthes]|uniref:Histone deacetylase 14 n=1 Tax=Dichanthelium oligosanthes TaxID=888268 RepID=A0A1E5UTH8_9POAL|nr:Histone deacetylase 14 [Dichanthelium oligosanthes]
MLPLLRHCCAFGSHHPLTWRSIFQTSEREQKHIPIRSWSAQCLANYEGASVSDKDNPLKKIAVPDNSLLDAHILYCTSPALGHNKEAHPESNKRVPAIVDALEKLELTPKVLEIQNFNPASLDDVARVHSRSYITGLEKAMSTAADEGLIFIEGTGPTYATETTFQESLLSAGAGITLVDSVVAASKLGPNPPLGFALLGSYPGTGKINEVGQGDGEGTTLNLPLPGGSGDYAMRCAFDEVIAPSAQRFKPDIILVSAG